MSLIWRFHCTLQVFPCWAGDRKAVQVSHLLRSWLRYIRSVLVMASLPGQQKAPALFELFLLKPSCNRVGKDLHLKDKLRHVQSVKEQKECQDTLKAIGQSTYFLLVKWKIGFYSEHGTNLMSNLQVELLGTIQPLHLLKNQEVLFNSSVTGS